MFVNLLNHNKVYNNCNIYLQIKKKKKKNWKQFYLN